MNFERVEKDIEPAVAQASFFLRKDVLKLLKRAYALEKKKKAKQAIGWILENADIAAKESLALCQDTGLPVVFIEAGSDVDVSASLVEAIKKGVEAGYRKNSLRASMVDPLKRKSPSYKGGIYHLEFSGGKGLKVTVFPKGFGSENKSKLKMFNPTASIGQIEDFVVKCVKDAGPQSCPPFIVGLGIGGTSDEALLLAKKSLLSDISKSNPDKQLREIEKRLLKKINSLKIGPMGLGGNNTCLGVKIKKAPTHIAGLPVGVNISCWALRSKEVNLKV